MIVLSDLATMAGSIIGAFALGYCSSYLFYLFRRVVWGAV